MPQLVQTNDRGNRLAFKGALAHKVETALKAPAPETENPTQVLLLPHNFDTLSETDLHFSLMHNKELKHSRQTANLAVEIVFNKVLHPKTVTFQTVELKNPVQIPQFEKKATKRSSPKQLTAPDSTAVRMQAEKDKEAEFKAYIETLSNRTRTDQTPLPAIHPVVLRVPKNYNDFSEAELFNVLTHTTELEHSRNSAYLAMDILSGKVVKPQHVTLQSVVLATKPTPVQAPAKAKEVVPSHVIEAERDKREQFKAQLANKASVVSTLDPTIYIPEFIELALPSHYKELSEAGLFYTLTHNPELQHSHDSATLAVDIIFKKSAQPESVKFHMVDLVEPEAITAAAASTAGTDPLDGFIPEREMAKRAELKTYLAEQTERILASAVVDEEPVVLKVPKNYKELSQDELLYVLINSTELAHNRASAYRTMDMLSGKVAKPQTTTLQAVVLTKPVAAPVVNLTPAKKIETAIHPAIKANEDAKYEAYLASQTKAPAPVVSEKELILRVPANYKEISEAELLSTITNNLEYGHTHYTAYLALDILSGRVKKPANVTLKAVKFAEKVVTAAATAGRRVETLPDIVVERERFKREAFKSYLAGKAARKAEVLVEPTETTILRVPSNYAELNETELLYVLMNNVELAHTRNSAYNTIDFLSGAVAKPQNITLQAVKLEAPKPVPSVQLSEKKVTTSIHPGLKASDNPKRQLFKEELADRARTAFNAKPVIEEAKALKVILLPEGYESMTPGELHFALVRNPELGHSQESARYAVDVLEGKIKNAPVQFSVVILENPALAPAVLPKAVKPKVFNTEKKSSVIINRPALLSRAQIPLTNDPGDARVLKIPHNYEEMNETQLHFALSHNREYGHSFESTYETLDILYGRTPCPEGTVFSSVEVDRPIERAY